MLRYEGKSNPEIAEKLDISTDRISHLVSQFKRDGLDVFMRMKYTGHHRNMTYEEEQAILDRFSEQAEAGQIVTVKEIKAAFDEKLGRDTGRGYIQFCEMITHPHRHDAGGGITVIPRLPSAPRLP